MIKLRLIQLRPEKGSWIKYLFLPLVLLIAVLPQKGVLNTDLRSDLVLLTVCLLILYVGFAVLKAVGPDFVEIGHLVSSPNRLTLTVEGQETSFFLSSFIQLNGGETYRFEMPTEQAQENLRTEIRRWYLLKVKVKEHRRDGPTLLLHRDLSYEQIQAYKQEFGVGLYG